MPSYWILEHTRSWGWLGVEATQDEVAALASDSSNEDRYPCMSRGTYPGIGIFTVRPVNQGALRPYEVNVMRIYFVGETIMAVYEDSAAVMSTS